MAYVWQACTNFSTISKRTTSSFLTRTVDRYIQSPKIPLVQATPSLMTITSNAIASLLITRLLNHQSHQAPHYQRVLVKTLDSHSKLNTCRILTVYFPISWLISTHSISTLPYRPRRPRRLRPLPCLLPFRASLSVYHRLFLLSSHQCITLQVTIKT